MRHAVWLICGLLLCLAGPLPQAMAADPGVFTAGAGIFGILPYDYPAAEARVQYRFGTGLGGGAAGGFIGIKPLIGGLITADEGNFIYAALAAPYVWGDGKYEIEPSAGIGAYGRGDGAPLGGTAQFHVGLGFSARMTENGRLGVMLAHISNAHVLHDENPGTNSLLITWSWVLAGR